jgi:hypothetical protein
MKRGSTVFAETFAVFLLIQPAVTHAKNVASPNEQQASTAESELVSHGHNTNKDKQVVHSPSKSTPSLGLK